MLEKIAPTWMNVSIKMKEDEETDKAFGWVLEMYNHIFYIDMILTFFEFCTKDYFTYMAVPVPD
jgi:hypothetical protein